MLSKVSLVCGEKHGKSPSSRGAYFKDGPQVLVNNPFLENLARHESDVRFMRMIKMTILVSV